MKKKNTEKNRRQIVLLVICLSLLFGIILGAVFANHLNEIQYNELGGHLNGFINEMKNASLTQNASVSDVMVKYGKYAVLIWLCAFFAPGAVFIILILLFKGASYGFTTAILVRQYGKAGISFAAVSYLPQNIILIPVYLCISYFALEYILRKYKALPPKARLKRESQKVNLEYLIILLASVVLIAAASAVEVYVIPFFLTA